MNKTNKKQTKKSPTTHGLTFVIKKQVKKLPLYHVEWRDHTISINHGEWANIDDLGVKALTCYTVGFQVGETEEAIALCQNVGENGKAGEVMTILKSCIVRKEKL